MGESASKGPLNVGSCYPVPNVHYIINDFPVIIKPYQIYCYLAFGLVDTRIIGTSQAGHATILYLVFS